MGATPFQGKCLLPGASGPGAPHPMVYPTSSFYNSKASHFRNGQVVVPDTVPTSGFTVVAVLKLMDICLQAMRTAFFHMSKTPWGNGAPAGPD